MQGDFTGGSEVKASACNVGDLGSIPGSGRCPGEGNGNPLQYSCLESPMDGGSWWAAVQGGLKELDTTEQLQKKKKKRLCRKNAFTQCCYFKTRRDSRFS